MHSQFLFAGARRAYAAHKDAGSAAPDDPIPTADAPDDPKAPLASHVELVKEAADAMRDMLNANSLEDVRIQLAAWADRLDAAAK